VWCFVMKEIDTKQTNNLSNIIMQYLSYKTNLNREIYINILFQNAYNLKKETKLKMTNLFITILKNYNGITPHTVT
jgi:hypothetical protein